ncbi:polysaccharide deacetylase family protein [Pseudarthrobacter equi]|uniref:polysaccharide deacetylase family protein n=1 Tax=Pseudarthrobacter equi TaxID=728066 RepID=UPI0021BE30B2|nr:polysaccharide deacetylase family protein [Pseudarthrobacter equi]MCT9625615.1 polysaccharide deacetylase family protein [Pseudarthrobacter equi]
MAGIKGAPAPITVAGVVTVVVVIALLAAAVVRIYFSLLPGAQTAYVPPFEAHPVVRDVDPYLPGDATHYEAPPPRAQVAPVPGQTVVSLTFDDGNASDTLAAKMLADRGMVGTFFISSGSIGKPGYLSYDGLRTVAALGHEIGGHTVNHLDLTAMPLEEAQREVCLDRSTLTEWGFNVRNFAYPYASEGPEIRKAAMDCGYNSARGLGEVRTRFGCEECEPAAVLPPATLDNTAAPAPVTVEWTLDDLKESVRAAQPAGGWVQLTFHSVCTKDCDYFGVNQGVLAEFLTWLQGQAQAGSTVVRPVEEVVGGPVQPAVAGPARSPRLIGTGNALLNPGLDVAGGPAAELPPNAKALGSLPTCWQVEAYGSHQAEFGASPLANTGDAAVSLRMQGYVNGEAKLMPSMDLGHCAPPVAAGRQYTLEASYKSTAMPQFTVYYRVGRGVWVYWTSSKFFPASDSFTRAQWVTPPVPPGATAISFGLGLVQNGDLVTDDYALTETAGVHAG